MTTATQTPRLEENRERGSHSVQRLVPHHGRKHLDLFSGIGGFALAAQRAGWSTIGFCEIETYACQILKKHWPDVPNYGDIRNVRGIHADLLTGGFPCQPFSVAGKRRGASDDRALWPEMLRVIGESRPCWVLGENVAGIINMELDNVLSDLEAIGYAAWPLVIPACATDARHRRDRLWIVAYSESGQSGQPSEREGRQSAGGRSGDSTRHQNSRRETVSDTNGTQCKRRCFPVRIQPQHANISDSCWWQPEPGVGRMANGIPNRVDRLKGLGNAIVPQVAAEIIRTMMRVELSDPTKNGSLH